MQAQKNRRARKIRIIERRERIRRVREEKLIELVGLFVNQYMCVYRYVLLIITMIYHLRPVVNW